MSEVKEYLIGLDLGTSTIKGILMSVEGVAICKEKEENRLDIFENGYVQFNVEEFYLRIIGVIRKLVSSLPKNAGIAGICMVSASGNTVLVDETGKPMVSAFSWMDTRVTNEMDQILSSLKEDEVHNIVGWPLMKTFPLAHLSWLKYHKSELLKKASMICMSTEYVNFRLTNVWGIDNSTASTFYLQDQLSAKWYLPFLDILGISESKLPPILSQGTVLGHLTQDAAEETGLPVRTPVILGSFDHPGAARGAGVLEEGQLLISCGTSWVGFYPIKDRRHIIKQKMVADPFLNPEGPWGAIFSLPAVANGIDRCVRNYISCMSDRYFEFDKLAASAESGSGGLCINPLQEDEPERLCNYSKANIARSLMECTVFMLKMKMEEMAKSCINTISATMVGGPSESHIWSAIVSDILGIPISTVNGSYTGAVGAAILAGIGTGLYINSRDAFQKKGFTKIIEPSKELHNLYEDSYTCFKNYLNDVG